MYCVYLVVRSPILKKSNNYFYQINSLVKEYEFYTAKVKENKIILYNNEFQEMKEIEFEEYNQDIHLLGIRKENDKIYYITDGAVDDEDGIVFINSDSNDLLDGIKSLKRVGGNSYQYSTNN